MASFVEEVEKDLRWREEELAALKLLASSAVKSSARERALLRALTALLYAHYEGFCKFCWDLYVEVLSNQKPQKRTLIDSVKIAALESEILDLKKNMSHSDVVKFLDSYGTYCRVAQPIKINLDIDSNLWPDRFQKIMDRLSLSSDCIKTYNTEIRALVGRRNGIAHGEKLIIADIKAYEQFENCALLVMHELAINIADALEGQTYMKKRYRKKSIVAVAAI